jgi:hypothetical protein
MLSKSSRRSAPRRPDAPVLAPSDYGTFNGPVRARWLPDGRFMALCEALEFTERHGPTWTAPVATRTDGASIPPVFWSVIGGPFEGKYRDAAVIHDYECCIKARPWRAVHRMFYAGMMANGEALWRAKLMYFAVYFFGPRWPSSVKHPDLRFMEGDIARAAKHFQRHPETTLEDIENLTRATLRLKVIAVPQSIRGASLLSDTRKIVPVKRNGPCLELGPC